jgi:putative SOS response-associated peptidase YedK
MFRDAFARRRCLMPVSAFYEWKGQPGAKQPYAIAAAHDQALTLAGLWERWKSPEGQWVETCAVVTGAPNAKMAELHDRMPVILGEDDWSTWLGEREGDVAALLRPCAPTTGSNSGPYRRQSTASGTRAPICSSRLPPDGLAARDLPNRDRADEAVRR